MVYLNAVSTQSLTVLPPITIRRIHNCWTPSAAKSHRHEHTIVTIKRREIFIHRKLLKLPTGMRCDRHVTAVLRISLIVMRPTVKVEARTWFRTPVVPLSVFAENQLPVIQQKTTFSLNTPQSQG